MADLVNHKADMCMTALKINSDRQKDIDMSIPFHETGIAILVALRRGALSPTAFLGIKASLNPIRTFLRRAPSVHRTVRIQHLGLHASHHHTSVCNRHFYLRMDEPAEFQHGEEAATWASFQSAAGLLAGLGDLLQRFCQYRYSQVSYVTVHDSRMVRVLHDFSGGLYCEPSCVYDYKN